MIAIIATGGKQYIVKEGDEIKVEKLGIEAGKTVDFTPLLVSDEDGSAAKVGTPDVAGAKVTATVVEEGRDKKLTVIKYKPKSRYRRKYGHRQPYTKLKIDSIKA